MADESLVRSMSVCWVGSHLVKNSRLECGDRQLPLPDECARHLQVGLGLEIAPTGRAETPSDHLLERNSAVSTIL